MREFSHARGYTGDGRLPAPWHEPLVAGLERPLLLGLLGLAFATHAFRAFQYPAYLTDEGVYMQQAWAVLNLARLSPYTYIYDHAPAGWLLLASWVALLPLKFSQFGLTINSGRAFMVVLHVVNTYLLVRVAQRLTGSTLAGLLAGLLFSLSPLAVYYQRMVLLDNLMVFWVLLSLWLILVSERRVMTLLGSGFAFGMAVLTKENALFLTPVVVFLLYCLTRRSHHFRFAVVGWAFTAVAVISVYALFAALKNELLPTSLEAWLMGHSPQRVSLVDTILWQLGRRQGSALEFGDQSPFWRFSLGSWIPKDWVLLAIGTAATLWNLVVGLRGRANPAERATLIAALLSLAYLVYLGRGSVMLEFYVVPLLPFLALNAGLAFARWVRTLPPTMGRVVLAALLLPLVVVWTVKFNEEGVLKPVDPYDPKIDLTGLQAQQIAFVRQNLPPQATIIGDDDIWVDLHVVRPAFPRFHSHFKASSDPDVSEKLLRQDWRRIDYLVMSNKMTDAMQLNNSDGKEDFIFEALDHSTILAVFEQGDVRFEVRKVNK
ncbi:MAG: glycosyltransferase family 39 protein [Chloroflexi bacterium]|nr:glycosyltransferase family 39 protein [Chloroflexota bacterium]